MNETIRLINNRKSLRVFTDKEIARTEIDLIIKGAMRAPTAGNMMLYSMIEVSKQSVKDRLAETCDHQPFIAKAPLVILFLADFQRWHEYFCSFGVPELCESRGVSYETPKEADLMLACCDALIAAQNAVVTAESIGIGSCYIGDIMENVEIHRELFNLPKYTFPITMLCFGYYKESYLTQKPRSRFDQEFIHFKDTYRHLSGDEFQDMFRQYEKEPSKEDEHTENHAQRTYFRKTGAEFSLEMRRSVKLMLEAWK